MFITTASGKEADKIARGLVGRGLAACVNIIPSVKSVYTWKGRLEVSNEFLLMAKTKQSLFCKLEKTVRSMHSYDCPEIISVPVNKGSRDYLQWLGSSIKKR
ncbi:MAG: divalent-cation tolerance protein CutA [Candidatus Omnitrophota bacterium]